MRHYLCSLSLAVLTAVTLSPTPATAQFYIPDNAQVSPGAQYQNDTARYQKMLGTISELHQRVKQTAGSASFQTADWEQLVAMMRELNGLHRNTTKGQDLLPVDFNYADPASRERFIAQMQAIITERQAKAEKQDYAPVRAPEMDGAVQPAPEFDTAQPLQDEQEQPQRNAATIVQEQQQQAALATDAARQAYDRAAALTRQYRAYYDRALALHQQEQESGGSAPRFIRDDVTTRYDQLLTEARDWHERAKATAGSASYNTAWEPMLARFNQLNAYHQANSQQNLLGENFNYYDVAAREQFLNQIKQIVASRDQHQREQLKVLDANQELQSLRRRLSLTMRELDSLYRRQAGLNPYEQSIAYDDPGQRVQFLTTIANHINEREAYLADVRGTLGEEVMKNRLRFKGGRRISPLTGDPI